MRLEDNIKKALNYVGIIGSTLMCIAYIVIVLVLVQGFSTKMEWTNNIIFSLVNAAVGCIIMQLLKIQGITFAKSIPENEEVLKQYYNTITKVRKPKSITHYWWTSVIKDVLMKGLTLGASTFGLIFIVIQGSHDYHLLLLAIVNLLMFICFGLLSLNSAYDFYNNEHIPFLKSQMIEREQINDSQRQLCIEKFTGTSSEKPE